MQAVIFDLDGVIIDSHAIAQGMMRQCAARNGIPLDEADYRAWLSMSGNMFWAAMKQKHALPMPIGYYREDYNVEEEIRRYAMLQPIPGVLGLMDRLTAADVRLGLATSGSRRRLTAVLELFGLTQHFAATLTASDVMEAKPSGEMFERAAEQLRVPPGACVVIEDTPVGVEAARRAGMCVVGYVGPGSAKQKLTDADLVVENFDQLTHAELCDVVQERRSMSEE